jgi:hypothetical protein
MDKSKKGKKPKAEQPARHPTPSHGVEEPGAEYVVAQPKSPAKPTEPGPPIRYAKMADVLPVNAKLLEVHQKVLRKLAQ